MQVFCANLCRHIFANRQGINRHARLTPPGIQVRNKFQSGFQALVDTLVTQAWIKIVHNSVNVDHVDIRLWLKLVKLPIKKKIHILGEI